MESRTDIKLSASTFPSDVLSAFKIKDPTLRTTKGLTDTNEAEEACLIRRASNEFKSILEQDLKLYLPYHEEKHSLRTSTHFSQIAESLLSRLRSELIEHEMELGYVVGWLVVWQRTIF